MKKLLKNNLIENLKLSNDLVIIDEQCFRNNSLTFLKIPHNVEIIATKAFQNNSLVEIEFSYFLEVIEKSICLIIKLNLSFFQNH